MGRSLLLSVTTAQMRLSSLPSRRLPSSRFQAPITIQAASSRDPAFEILIESRGLSENSAKPSQWTAKSAGAMPKAQVAYRGWKPLLRRNVLERDRRAAVAARAQLRLRRRLSRTGFEVPASLGETNGRARERDRLVATLLALRARFARRLGRLRRPRLEPEGSSLQVLFTGVGACRERDRRFACGSACSLADAARVEQGSKSQPPSARQTKKAPRGGLFVCLAEREGFEPSIRY